MAAAPGAGAAGVDVSALDVRALNGGADDRSVRSILTD
jgi:hypothetical protein